MATGTQLKTTAAESPGATSLAGGMSALWTRGRVQWAGMQPKQRTWAVLSMLLLAGTVAFLGWFALRTDWRVLYAGLDADDARQMGQTLTQAQIPFDIADGGGTIRVAAPQLDKARLATAGKGGVKSGRMGFELFDKPNWVGSEFDEKVNYQRALEGELEHTVASLADVESARVHLVMPRDSLFREEERPAKASVVLKLRHHSLGEGEPESIRNLVASAVDGLSAENVVLVDAAGHIPLGPRTMSGLRLTAEQALEEKLISTLEPVTGAGNVRASVTLDYDDAASEQTQETYDPAQTATLSMQRTEQASGAQPIAAGVPGTASNAPNAQALPVYPQQTSSPQSAKTESSTYGVSKLVKHVTQNPGRVRRLTAAVVVNDRQVQVAAKSKPAVWQPRSVDELRNLTMIAQAAVGFDSARGDVITVQDLAFEDNHAVPTSSPLMRALSAVERFPLLIKYGVILVGILVVTAFGVRPAARRAAMSPGKTAGRELPAPGAAAKASLPPPEPPAEDPDRIRAQSILDEVSAHLKREPAQSSRLLQSWIHSE